MDHLKKLKEKKGMHKMHPLEQKAKLGVMHELQKMASDAMGGKLKGLKKVTVAADSEEGLEHGLDKAHDVLKGMPSDLDDSNPDHEHFDHSEDDEDGNDGMGHGVEHLAMGGEAGEEELGEESEDDGAADDQLPNYDDMDKGEMSAHLEALVAAMKSKGLA